MIWKKTTCYDPKGSMKNGSVRSYDLKTISDTRGQHYSANYREWLHKEIKAIDKKLKEIEGDLIDGY